MVPRETSYFYFPWSPNVSLDFVSGINISTLGKTKLFPSGLYIKCIMMTAVYKVLCGKT